MTRRNSDGTFAAGSSGNPAGRPKRSDQEKMIIDEMCRLAPAALETLEQVLNDDAAPGYLRIKAAEIVFDRVCGKPMTAMEMDSYEGYQDICKSLDSFRFNERK